MSQVGLCSLPVFQDGHKEAYHKLALAVSTVWHCKCSSQKAGCVGLLQAVDMACDDETKEQPQAACAAWTMYYRQSVSGLSATAG